MWAPFAESASALARTGVPLAVLGASLAGSFHCASMCGGLVLAVASDRRRTALYHLGRLTGYSALGGVAGLAGAHALRPGSGVAGALAGLAAAALAAAFIFQGARIARGRPVHLPVPAALRAGYARLWRYSGLNGQGGPAGAALAGLLTAFLPCGWLHGFVLAAVATESPAKGALLLVFFWLGTLPALLFARRAVERIFRPLALQAPRISAALLLAAGLATLAFRVGPLFHPGMAGTAGVAGAPGAEAAHCRHSAD